MALATTAHGPKSLASSREKLGQTEVFRAPDGFFMCPNIQGHFHAIGMKLRLLIVGFKFMENGFHDYHAYLWASMRKASFLFAQTPGCFVDWTGL